MKIVYLTPHQLEITRLVALHFGDTLDGTEVRSMFRQSGSAMGVGLSYSEDGQHFIVRELIPGSASPLEVQKACTRLMLGLVESFAKVIKRDPSWAM